MNERISRITTDSRVATGMLLIGGALIVVATRRSPTALMFFPGLEGSVTTLILASVLLSIQGVRAKRLALLYVPLILLQILSMQRTGFAWLGSLGLELAAIGAIALGFASFRRSPTAPVPPRSRSLRVSSAKLAGARRDGVSKD